MEINMNESKPGHYPSSGITPTVPVMTREAWAAAIGLPVSVVTNQCDRGYWPCVKVGKYSLINVEAVRAQALERAREFVL